MHEGSRSGETRGGMGEVIRKRFDAFQEREVLLRLIRLAHARPTISVCSIAPSLPHSCDISETAIVSCCFLISHQLVGWTERPLYTFETKNNRAHALAILRWFNDSMPPRLQTPASTNPTVADLLESGRDDHCGCKWCCQERVLL
jgi:hypothetical protein